MIILPAVPTLPNNPRIGWRNFVTAAGVTVSSAADGFPGVNLANGLTWLLWRATSTAAQTLTFDLGAATQVDYVGIARHNLGSAAASYTLQRSSDGSSWSTVVGPITPTDDGVIIHEFDAVTYRYFRLSIGSGSTAVQIAVVYLGRILTLARRIYVGHVPLPFGMKSTVSTGRSESGQFLGRVVRRKFYETGVQIANIDPDWCRDNIEPFIEAAAEEPFFWAWRPTLFPTDVGYVWTRDDINPENQRPNGMMQLSMGLQGILE